MGKPDATLLLVFLSFWIIEWILLESVELMKMIAASLALLANSLILMFLCCSFGKVIFHSDVDIEKHFLSSGLYHMRDADAFFGFQSYFDQTAIVTVV